MATHDYNIANGTGAAVRADINNVLAAIQSTNANSSAPSTTVAFQLWADTSSGTLKIRNAANSAFIELFQLDGTFTLEDGSASSPALGFRDDLNTGIFSGGADEFNIATGGIERFVINSSGNCGIGTVSPTDKLHVVGDVEFELGSNLFDVMSTGSGSKHTLRLLNADASAGNKVGIQFGPANNVVGASIEGIAESDFTSSANRDGALSFTTRLNGTLSEAMRIDSSGRLLLGTSTAYSAAGGGNMMVSVAKDATSRTDVSISNQSSADDASAALVLATHGQDYILEATGSGNSNDGARALRILKGNDERFRIDSSGNVLVNVSSATAGSNTYKTIIQDQIGSGEQLLGLQYSGVVTYGINAESNGDLTIKKDGTARMTLASSGDFLLGVSGWTTSSGGLFVEVSTGSGGAVGPVQIYSSRPSSFTGTQNLLLNYHNGTYIGGINTTTTGTSFPTSSDYRLKENVVAMSDGITRLKTLKPYKFNFKVEPSKTVDGFFAHEVSSVVPDAVFGEKDGKEMQALDQSKLVPLVVAAVQELIGKVEALEAA